jgi:hypothetical protein
MMKDFAFAHLVPAPYTSGTYYEKEDESTVLVVSRKSLRGDVYVSKCYWDLAANATDADAQPVVDQLVSGVRSQILNDCYWYGKNFNELSAEEYREAVLHMMEERLRRDDDERDSSALITAYATGRGHYRRQRNFAWVVAAGALGALVGHLLVMALT